MEVVITDWSLQSYVELLEYFTEEEYRNILRPDAEILAYYPSTL